MFKRSNRILSMVGLCFMMVVSTTLANDSLVLYSGRSESLVGPLIEQFKEKTGIDVRIRWGKTSELAATILEEGQNSPADVFYAQDPGGLGALADQFTTLPDSILDKVNKQFRSPEEKWVGLSGRARVVVYNTEAIDPQELPTNVWGFTKDEWSGRIGWAPSNASFQVMVTAMRKQWGEEKTAQWLKAIKEKDAIDYPKNTPIVEAAGSGEIDVGFVNHYYLFRFLDERGEKFKARNHFLEGGGPGSLIMVSGAGILSTAQNKENAITLINYLLSKEAQQYFANETFEYPLISEVETHPLLTPLEKLIANSNEINVATLSDLRGTLKLLRDTNVLP